jgi:Tol biopolymer transport system component
VQVADDVAANAAGSAAFGASDDGRLLALRPASRPIEAELAWYDRDGHTLGTAGEPGNYDQVRLSPDDRRLATARWDLQAAKFNLWTVDLATNIMSQFVAEDQAVNDPVWSGDSQSVAFESLANNKRDFFSRAIGGASTTSLFESPDTPKWLHDWTRDGRYLLFHLPSPSRLYAVPTSGDRTPVKLAEFRGAIDEVHASPDGKRVAYGTNESGQWEVWVASFPALGDRQQVSAQGGQQPHWRRDGRELFYLAPDGAVMSVALTVTASGVLQPQAPTRLFQSPIAGPRPSIDQYAVTGDGKRFLFIQPRKGEAVPSSPITVIVNWPALIRK